MNGHGDYRLASFILCGYAAITPELAIREFCGNYVLTKKLRNRRRSQAKGKRLAWQERPEDAEKLDP
jgi:hypothetical protein